MKKLFLLFLTLFLLMSACTQKIDTTADIEAINKLTEKWDELMNAGEFDAVLSLYVDNPIRMHPNEPMLTGKEAIRSSFQTYQEEQIDSNFENTNVDVIVSGDYATVRGVFTGTYTPKATGKLVHAKGNFVSLRQRQADGTWKIVFDIWNSELPLIINE